MKHPLILFCALGATSPVARAKSGAEIPLKQFPIILSHIGAACPQPQNPPKVDTPP